MALALARLLVARGAYDPEHARAAYQDWLASRPFDCGSTIRAGLLGRPNAESQANDALMRVSPLGIFGATYPSQLVADWAKADAALTHPHPICVDANRLYVMALSFAITSGAGPPDVYEKVMSWCRELDVMPDVTLALGKAVDSPPAEQSHGFFHPPKGDVEPGIDDDDIAHGATSRDRRPIITR